MINDPIKIDKEFSKRSFKNTFVYEYCIDCALLTINDNFSFICYALCLNDILRLNMI